MLFRKDTLEGIRAGDITLAFRRWKRPTVKSGGTLLTAVGQLSIVRVDIVALRDISARDAELAGFATRDALLNELQQRADGDVYRVELGALVADPRIALRKKPVESDAELESLRARLRKLDSSASEGAWTLQTLEVIEMNPAVRAGDLCEMLGMEKEPFKINVRKLKRLGLTESLDVGYRLSPRGETVLASLWR